MNLVNNTSESSLLKINKSWKPSDIVLFSYRITFEGVNIHSSHDLMESTLFVIKNKSFLQYYQDFKPK